MLYAAALLAKLLAAVAFDTGIDSPYRLFSQTKMTGSFQSEAKFTASWNAPVLAAPSPKKQTTHWSVLRIFMDNPTPVASGMPEPTMPTLPKTPRLISAMCIDPPFPLHDPVSFPRSSAIILSSGTPFAMQCPCPRCVLTR